MQTIGPTRASSPRGAPAPRAVGGRTPGAPSPASCIGATPVEGPRGRLRKSAVLWPIPACGGPLRRHELCHVHDAREPCEPCCLCGAVCEYRRSESWRLIPRACRPPCRPLPPRGSLRIDSRPGPPAAIVTTAGRLGEAPAAAAAAAAASR